MIPEDKCHRWPLFLPDHELLGLPFAAPDPALLAGLCWHHALHARVCIERSRWWQAERWICELRGHLITLACLRLGLPAEHARGAHLLPASVTAPLEPALVTALAAPELRRALCAAVAAMFGELQHTDSEIAARLRPMLTELTDPADDPVPYGNCGATIEEDR